MSINPTFSTAKTFDGQVLFDPNNNNAEVHAIYDQNGVPTYYDLEGNIYTPTVPADLTTSITKDHEVKDICFKATSAGTGYAIGDIVTLSIVFDVTSGTAVESSRFYTNQTTGAVVANGDFVITNFEPCGATPEGIEKEGMLYFSATDDSYHTGIQTWNEDGSYAGIVFYDETGAVSTPTSPVPVGARDNEKIESCFNVVAAGTGYAIGDVVKLVVFVDTLTMETIGSAYINMNTGLPVTIGAPTDIEPCAAPETFIRQEVLLDYDKSLPVKEFLRVYTTVDGVTTSADFELDGVTAYTVLGDVYRWHQRFGAFASGATLPFTDGAVVTLPAPPAQADVAEIHVWGGGIVWDKRQGASAVTADGSVGFGRQADGAYFELEGFDEIANFQFIGMTGQSGRLEVHYAQSVQVNN